jgi:hypothetical protein
MRFNKLAFAKANTLAMLLLTTMLSTNERRPATDPRPRATHQGHSSDP